MKRLMLCGAALAMTLAGAFPLWARDREDEWRGFLKRCDGRTERREEKKLDQALGRMSAREKAKLQARLKRIELMTKAWVRAERQAQALRVAEAVLGTFGPAPEAIQLDLRSALQAIMQLNGFGTPRQPGVLGRRGKQMI